MCRSWVSAVSCRYSQKAAVFCSVLPIFCCLEMHLRFIFATHPAAIQPRESGISVAYVRSATQWLSYEHRSMNIPRWAAHEPCRYCGVSASQYTLHLHAGIDKCIKTPLLIQTDTSFEVSEYTLRSVHAFATVHCVNVHMGHTVWHGRKHILHITTHTSASAGLLVVCLT